MSQQQTVREFSEIVYHNIFVFIRDLMIFSFASKFYSGIVPIVIEEKETESKNRRNDLRGRIEKISYD